MSGKWTKAQHAKFRKTQAAKRAAAAVKTVEIPLSAIPGAPPKVTRAPRSRRALKTTTHVAFGEVLAGLIIDTALALKTRMDEELAADTGAAQ